MDQQNSAAPEYNRGLTSFAEGTCVRQAMKESCMTTNYDPIAEQYKRSKQQPWRTYIEAFTLMEIIGDPQGMSVRLTPLSQVCLYVVDTAV
jgi:hypothetical protein